MVCGYRANNEGYPGINGTQAGLVIFDFNGSIDTRCDVDYDLFAKAMLGYDGRVPEYPNIEHQESGVSGKAYYGDVNLTIYVRVYPMPGSSDKVVVLGCFNDFTLLMRLITGTQITGSD